MFRQNAVLNDFVNFLKARGRFRDIEFIENSVHATPRIPGFPMIIFYIEETQADPKDLHYVLEIHGAESSVMNREIREFFKETGNSNLYTSLLQLRHGLYVCPKCREWIDDLESAGDDSQ